MAGVAREPCRPYLGHMLPRPSSPRALWADIRAFAGERSPHQWVAAGLALAIPLAIVVMFLVDSNKGLAPGPTITFIDSWSADRTDAQIIAQQKSDQARREAAMKERQRQFKKLDKDLEKMGL